MYGQLIRFLLPLVITELVMETGAQILNGGMARMPRATETLASYGLAWGIVSFMTGALTQTRQMALAVVYNLRSLHTARLCVYGFGLVMLALLAALAFTPVGVWVVEGLHGVDAGLGAVVREAMCFLMPVPLLTGLSRFYSGMLLRIRRTDLISYAVSAGVVANIATVFILLPTGLIQGKPILLPLFVTYAGLLTELVVVFSGYRRFARPELQSTGQSSEHSDRPPLTLAYVFRFYWPLALIMGVQGISRPLVNLFISREAEGAEELAVLTIVYALAHLPYGWLNELRNLAPAFQRHENSTEYIRRFALICGALSFGVMIALFWTPLRWFLLETLIGVDHAFAVRCATPLMVFSFFPLVVMIRAHLHGIVLREHRTGAIAPSGPARVAAIVVVITLLGFIGVEGATRGVAALLSGFMLETLVVWRGLKRDLNDQPRPI